MQTYTRTPFPHRPLPAALLLLLLLLLLLSSAAAWAQPTISSFSPASGPAGTSVTVTGSGFSNVTSVRFGELSATFTLNSTTQLTAIVPRAASTQVINVTTTAGSEISPTAFAVTRNASLTYTLQASNFAGVNVGSNAAPAVADLDGNNRLDLLVGRGDGTIARYEQTGINSTTFGSPSLLATSGGTIDRGTEATVAIVDTDSDGKFNVLLGGADGFVYDYEQTAVGSATFMLMNNFVGQISTTTNSATSVTNLDGDGRLELVTGKGDGIVSYAEQLGRNDPDFAIYDTNYQTLTSNTAPFCVDLDGNGRVDVLIGVAGGNIYRFEQSAANNPTLTQRTSVFNSIDVGTNAKPCVTDIDGDGLLDLLIGRGDGTIDRYEQTPPANTAPTALALNNSTVTENMAAGSTVGTFSATDAEGGPFTYTLVSGGADNGSFSISGSTLTINASPDFEVKNSYAIRVHTTDPGGLTYERAFTIFIIDVPEVPTITNFTPTNGPVGTSVIITGTHFNDAGAVTVGFNGTTAPTVTVNSNTQITATVPAGATTGTISVTNLDGTGTSSAAFTVIVPAPNTTIVSGPPVIGNSATVNFVFSSDQSPVDYTTSGAPNATYSGNGANSSFGPIPDGTYTLSVAARNTSTNVSDPTPATYPFTVDTQRPPVAVTSSAASSGGSTGTSPVPFTITFPEDVSGFGTGDVTVTGGTFTFSASSARVYSVTVTPAGPGSVVTVSVAANVATDAAGNQNTASNTYSITYAPAPVVSSLTPSSGPVGTSVVVAGSNFTGATAVRFNGTAASFVVNSSSQITAVVAAGTTTGPFTVTTPAGVSNNNGTFTVTAANTSTILSSSANPSTFGQSITFTATVSNTNGSATPTGTVTFQDGSTTLGTGTLSGGVATFSTSALSAGTHSITAAYGATAGFNASTTAGLSQVVNAPANQAPVVTVPATQSTPQNTALVFSSATGNALSVADADAGSGQLEIYLGAANGAITLSTTAGIAFNSGSSNGSGSMTFRGTLTAINNALNGLSFTPNSGFFGTGNLQVQANDLGNTGSGGAKTDSKTVTINVVQPVNQAPVVTVPAAQSTAANTALTFSTANGNALSVADADAGNNPLSIYLAMTNGAATLSTTAGLTFTSGTNGSGGFGFTGTLSAINAALNGLSFTPNSGFAGAASVQVQANDQGYTGSGGAKSDSKTVTINLATAAPVVSYPANGSTIASATPTYTGTAPAGSVVTVYVDNVSIGTTTATAGGGWSLLQPPALSQATHDVKATAQRSGTPVSGFGNVVSFTVDTTAPSVPTVNRPANGAFVDNLRPSYDGSGAAGSTITVYIDNVSVGTTAIAAGGGTWSFVQPTDLAQGSHTVKARATDAVGNVSAFGPANTFTVDTDAPAVDVSSPAGASGSTTSTTPVPFTITFSEPVTSFSLSDITVSSGTKGSFVAVSSAVYTFSVTPTGAGTITVSVPPAGAQDRAGNINMPSPSPAFNLVFQPRPTISSLSATAELPGMPVVVTGTGFTSASTATVGGVTANVTYTSTTSLTLTVPAGAAVGSSVIVVTTNSVSSSSAPAFSVLKVYDAVANCLSTVPYTTTGDGAWHYLLAPNGQVVAALQDTRAALGSVGLDFLITGPAGAVRQDGRSHRYLDRNWHLTASNSTFAGSSVNVRFYGLVSEFARLQAADASVSYATLKTTQYSGPNEDCSLSNNSATGEARTLSVAASTPGNGVTWFVADASVPDHFSEFYLTGSATPLPVELSAFTAEAIGSTVRLVWATASEKNSARFEVERSTDGRSFGRIGAVAAAGSSSAPLFYAFLDTDRPVIDQLYYRLRQVDLDGSASYSPVRTVAAGLSETPALAAYPVPARAGQHLRVSFAPAGAAVEVFNALGRRVAHATADPDGTAMLELPRELPTGVYVLRSDRQTRRLVVE